jgi:hypothetical protein
MEAGQTLMWFGNNGPELYDYPSWPQKRTVRALLREGVLRWLPAHNETQRSCGIYPIGVTPGRGFLHCGEGI